MSGFIENRAHGASERPGQNDRVLTWNASAAMLPLVGPIARDVVRHHERLGGLRRELAHLDERRCSLAWPERARRYELQEEIAHLDGEMQENLAELEVLGLALLAPGRGLIGFPTIVNDRRAFFSWQPGEDGLRFWNFAGDLVRRPVPESWTKPTRERGSRRRPRPDKK
jgi:hypothetical protein